MRLQGRLLVAAMAVATLLLGGCVVEPVRQPYYGPVVRVVPPSPYYEYPGTPPVVGYVWISGYWSWGGVRYVWVPGRWEAPRAGHYWVPHRWERDGEHWRQHGGHWERGTAPQPVPAPRIERHDEHRPPPGATYPPPRFEYQERQRFEQHERQQQQERQRIEQQERRHPESGPVYRPAPDRNAGSGEREIRRQPDDGGAVRFERREGPRGERDARPAPDRDGDRRQKRRDDDDRR